MSDTTEIAEGASDQLATEDKTSSFDSLGADEKEKIYKDYHNNNEWKTANRLKGEEHNKRVKDFETQKAQYEQQYNDRMKHLQKNEKDFIASVNTHREKTYNDKVIEYADAKLAMAELKIKYEDYDYKTVLDHYETFNNGEQYSSLEHAYLAWKGAQVEELVAEARANVVREAKNKKGLPATGKQEGVPNMMPDNLEDARESAHRSNR